MRNLISLIATAILLFSAPINADTVIQIDTPNPGDTTTTVTTSTTTAHTTGNLITQDFTDGNWEGTNQDSRHGSGTIAGIGGEYVESTITQSDIGLTDAQIQRGFTSTLGADIWFWEGTDQNQSVTMTQTYDDKLGNVTTQNRVVSGYCAQYNGCSYNNFTDTITIGPNLSTEGEATVRFDFTHTNTSAHRAADLKLPTLTIDYTNIATSSSTTVEYCWQKTPTTCPAQEEIAAVEAIIEQIDIIEQIEIEEDWFEEYEPTTITYVPEEQYEWEDDFQEDWYEEEDNMYDTNTVLLTDDDFFFEDEYIEEELYEPTFTEFNEDFELPEDNFYIDEEGFDTEEYSFEETENITLGFVEDIDTTGYYEEQPTEEYFTEVFDTEAFINDYIEEFDTEDIPEEIVMEINEEFTEEVFEEVFEEDFKEEIYEEVVTNEEEFTEEVFEEVVTNEEEFIEEAPEEVVTKEEEPLEEIAMTEEENIQEEPTPEETTNETEIEEQPDSEEPIEDEPIQEADDPQQEEVVEETIEEDGPELIEESVDTDIAEAEVEEEKPEIIFDVAAIEKDLKLQIKNKIELISATLTVVDAILSEQMIQHQPDIDSYANINNALFDNRQLPDGNMDFFNQINLESYQKTIYDDPSQLIAMVGTDATVVYEQKLDEARDETNKARFKLEALLNARNGI